jgi:hypothetical protein
MAFLSPSLGRVVAQPDSRRLPTAAVTVRSRVKSCGICDVPSGTEEGFLRVLRFPLPLIHYTDSGTVIIYHPGLAK